MNLKKYRPDSHRFVRTCSQFVISKADWLGCRVEHRVFLFSALLSDIYDDQNTLSPSAGFCTLTPAFSWSSNLATPIHRVLFLLIQPLALTVLQQNSIHNMGQLMPTLPEGKDFHRSFCYQEWRRLEFSWHPFSCVPWPFVVKLVGRTCHTPDVIIVIIRTGLSIVIWFVPGLTYPHRWHQWLSLTPYVVRLDFYQHHSCPFKY